MLYLAPVLGYILGSIPFGLLMGFVCGKDIRTMGSGNIGATNVVRTCGWGVGLPVFILDALKGFSPAFWIAPLLAPEHTLIAVLSGVAAILGHNFPVWLKFKGGKGVATSAGAVLAILPQALGIAFASFLLVVLITRYVSLGSMVAGVVLVAARFALCAHWQKDPFAAGELPLTVMAILLCLLLLIRHRANAKRLWAGTESKIGAKKKDKDLPQMDTDGHR